MEASKAGQGGNVAREAEPKSGKLGGYEVLRSAASGCRRVIYNFSKAISNHKYMVAGVVLAAVTCADGYFQWGACTFIMSETEKLLQEGSFLRSAGDEVMNYGSVAWAWMKDNCWTTLGVTTVVGMAMRGFVKRCLERLSDLQRNEGVIAFEVIASIVVLMGFVAYNYANETVDPFKLFDCVPGYNNLLA